MSRETFKKVITSNKKTAQINPRNIKLMEKFLKDKGTRSSELTVANYRSDLIIFLTWNLENNDNKFFVDIKKIAYSEFFSYCVDELQWGSARFSRMRSTLSSFSTFIERFFDDEYPTFRNVILKTVETMPKSARREKTVLTEDQIDYLLKWLENDPDPMKIEEALWIALAISSGARFAEILRFTTDIIDEKNTAFDDLFLVTTKAIKTKGRTREGKLLNKYIIKAIFLPIYKKWLPIREKIMKENKKSHTSIFIKPDGSPAEQGTVRSWVNKFEEHLNVPVYPHAFRHYTVTYLSRVGLSQELIVHLMGWSSEEMYKIYNDLDVKDREWKELNNLKKDLEDKD